MALSIFRRIHKVRYLLRVQHWRGRSVHSPFLYDVVRGAFMKNENLELNPALFQSLCERQFKEFEAKRICRLYAHLGYQSFTFSSSNYNNEDMVILTDEEVNNGEVVKIAEKASQQKKTVCLIIADIYKTRRRYKNWQLVSALSGGVAVDLYHTGYLFFDFYLNKQKFKMRF